MIKKGDWIQALDTHYWRDLTKKNRESYIGKRFKVKNTSPSYTPNDPEYYIYWNEINPNSNCGSTDCIKVGGPESDDLQSILESVIAELRGSK